MGIEDRIVWDLADGREDDAFERLDNHPVLAVSTDSRLVASPARLGLKVWDLQNGREVCTLTGHENRYRTIAFTADGSQLVTSSYDETVKVWDVQSGRERMTFTGHLHAGTPSPSRQMHRRSSPRRQTTR